MSESELPDDVDEWPADPFAVLGVRPGDDDAVIKRAYTRLIRRFKPEHHPDQFRRVREAYETCLERSQWYRPDSDPDPEPELDLEPTSTPPRREPEHSPRERSDPAPGPEPVPDPGAGTGPPEPPPRTVRPPRPEPVIDPADRAWAAAVAGRDGEAYAGLVDLARAIPDRVDLSLRLYWLLALNPALDPDRTRHDWLATALTGARLQGPAAELYRRELEADVGGALGQPYAGWATAGAAVTDLLTVARWRVAAAGRCQDYAAIESDLAALKTRLTGRDEEGWLSLLVTAYDWLTLVPREGPGLTVRTELGELRHLELRHGYMFDRVEETAHFAEELSWARWQLPQPVVELVRVSRAGHGTLRAGDVEAAAAALAAAPDHYLELFDRVARERGPALLIQAARAFEQYLSAVDPRDQPEFPPELVRGVARRLPGRPMLADYGLIRQRLLALLLDERIDPAEYVAAGAEDPDLQYRAFAGKVGNDPSLRVMWFACRLAPEAADSSATDEDS